MKILKTIGSSILALFTYLVLNIWLIVPLLALLILHFTLGLSLVWFWILLGIIILGGIIHIVFISVAVNTDTTTKTAETKYVLRKDNPASDAKKHTDNKE